jgi:hypothetical protein
VHNGFWLHILLRAWSSGELDPAGQIFDNSTANRGKRRCGHVYPQPANELRAFMARERRQVGEKRHVFKGFEPFTGVVIYIPRLTKDLRAFITAGDDRHPQKQRVFQANQEKSHGREDLPQRTKKQYSPA